MLDEVAERDDFGDFEGALDFIDPLDAERLSIRR